MVYNKSVISDQFQKKKRSIISDKLGCKCYALIIRYHVNNCGKKLYSPIGTSKTCMVQIHLPIITIKQKYSIKAGIV